MHQSAFGVLTFTEEGGIHSRAVKSRGGVIELWSSEEGLKRPTPVAWYREAAKYFRSIYCLAGSADRGEGGRDEDWDMLGRPEWPAGKLKQGDAWNRVTLHLERLVQSAGVKLTFIEPTSPVPLPVSGRRPQISFRGHGLWGALTVQLAYAVVGGQGLLMCAGCGQMFKRNGRRPQAGRRTYCPRCGKGSGWREANRLAQQERRARLRTHGVKRAV
jgi:hypothetical protein